MSATMGEERAQEHLNGDPSRNDAQNPSMGLQRSLLISSLALLLAGACLNARSLPILLGLTIAAASIVVVAFANQRTRFLWQTSRGLGIAALMSTLFVGLLGLVFSYVSYRFLGSQVLPISHSAFTFMAFAAAAASTLTARWAVTVSSLTNATSTIDALLAAGTSEANALRLVLPANHRSSLTSAALLVTAAVLLAFALEDWNRLFWPWAHAAIGCVLWCTASLAGGAVFLRLAPSAIFVEGRLPSRTPENLSAHFEASEESGVPAPPTKVYQARPDESESRGFASQFRPDGTTDDRPIT